MSCSGNSPAPTEDGDKPAPETAVSTGQENGDEGFMPENSLFFDEERVIAETSQMLQELDNVGRNMETLSHAYGESCKAQMRLVRMSDRMQADLRDAKQRLEEQAAELRELNRALNEEIHQRHLLEEEITRIAAADPLTRAANHASFLTAGSKEFHRSKRYNLPLALVLVKIRQQFDDQDSRSLIAGDKALLDFAEICREEIRATDTLGRIAGTQFGIILPETSEEGALAACERIHGQLAGKLFHYETRTVSLDSSFTSGCLIDEDRDFVSFLYRIDKSKNAGPFEGSGT